MNSHCYPIPRYAIVVQYKFRPFVQVQLGSSTLALSPMASTDASFTGPWRLLDKHTPLTSKPTPCQYNSIAYNVLAFPRLINFVANLTIN
jgi:hypothetical protein